MCRWRVQLVWHIVIELFTNDVTHVAGVWTHPRRRRRCKTSRQECRRDRWAHVSQLVSMLWRHNVSADFDASPTRRLYYVYAAGTFMNVLHVHLILTDIIGRKLKSYTRKRTILWNWAAALTVKRKWRRKVVPTRMRMRQTLRSFLTGERNTRDANFSLLQLV